MTNISLGPVTGLWRYPVKSMHAEPLAATKVWWHGFEGDRRYAFLRLSQASHFPWLTGRQVASLIQYRPSFEQPDDPVKSAITVQTPHGQRYNLEDPALRQELEQQAGEAIHLLHLGRGAYDSSAGISLISTSSLLRFGEQLEQAPAVERFRINILIDTGSAPGYPEDSWLGRSFQFGKRPDSARIRIIRPIVRCMMINLDPETAMQNPAILRTVAQQHATHAGVYAIPEQPGTISLGDDVNLLPDERSY